MSPRPSVSERLAPLGGPGQNGAAPVCGLTAALLATKPQANREEPAADPAYFDFPTRPSAA
eukprot:7264585-Alexandrium_andersonii.AAC.1